MNNRGILRLLLFSLLALIAGFIEAFITAGVHSLFFILLPLTAFAFGYFSSWRRGLFYGFLLFCSYTFAISIIWWGAGSPNLLYPFPSIYAFFAGGFGLLLIGALSPMVRKNIRSLHFNLCASYPGSNDHLVRLLRHAPLRLLLPDYHPIQQKTSPTLKSTCRRDAVSGEPYEELYEQPYDMPGHLTEDFTSELVDTEWGRMLKISIPSLKREDVPVDRYTANIIFRQKNVPIELIQLAPKYDAEQLDIVESRRMTWFVKSRESLTIERFTVPVKITADTQAQVRLTLWNRTDRSEAVNFTYSRSYPYTERIGCDISTGDEWVFVPAEASSNMSIRGISD